jgi:ABC-type Fe3+-hydroxamate transport system substrate-binding protein
MAVFLDQLQRVIKLPQLPRRIISLVPSQTELLIDLGLAGRIVGCTKFCIHPRQQLETVTKVGGTKQVDHNVIRQLAPDLIIANKEENERSDIEALMAYYPVWVSDINTLPDALQMISRVGEITGSVTSAEHLVKTIQQGFSGLPKPGTWPSAVYLIWRKPYMAAGADTFITDMLHYSGFTNAVTTSRYPVLNKEQLQMINPQVVLLSSEPYPFKEKHIEEIRQILPNAKVVLADGEMFSWYGSRLQYAPAYFAQLQI